MQLGAGSMPSPFAVTKLEPSANVKGEVAPVLRLFATE